MCHSALTILILSQQRRSACSASSGQAFCNYVRTDPAPRVQAFRNDVRTPTFRLAPGHEGGKQFVIPDLPAVFRGSHSPRTISAESSAAHDLRACRRLRRLPHG